MRQDPIISPEDIRLANILWEYMLLHHSLAKSDLLFVLGVTDLRIAHYAVDLYEAKWAPKILFTGGVGWSNAHLIVNDTEADRFKKVALERGVPEEDILIENKSSNTGENFLFGYATLKEHHRAPSRMILVTKPYMERRGWATFKKQWPEPQPEVRVSSPPILLEEYITKSNDTRGPQWIIHALVGDLARIKEYPKQGFQIEQEIPQEVAEAHQILIDRGYSR